MWSDVNRVAGVVFAGLLAGCTPSLKNDPQYGSVSHTPVQGGAIITAANSIPPVQVKRQRAVSAIAAATPLQIDDLIGLDETGIKLRLGAPTSQDDRAPNKRWVYRVRQCTMNVTFYPEVETRQFHALNYEVNSDDGSPKRQQSCIAEFSSRIAAKSDAK